ncbi:uncharacterized protein MJAP1_002358 [Malassezia japonica]|uniref:MARVEL domain-containing protein n=1 Tax=Malassezia japonica TaxID=223818 RepID=A0AAF0F6M0_9BASI|nr:uncharacterized protein MJAP1_002358 [Malassezia japonica]WFD39383.1 hypothetical protein MJAP1_002358 [Malassezia japonica]
MVDLSSTVRRGHPIAFGIFALLAFIVAVISSAVVASFNSNEQPKDNLVRDSTRFLIFAGWWGFLFSIVYIGLFLSGIGGFLSSIASHAVFIILTWIFWLAGSAALSSAVGNADCSNPASGIPQCSALRAICAFGWIGWLELTFMLAVIGYLAFKAFNGGRGMNDGFA